MRASRQDGRSRASDYRQRSMEQEQSGELRMERLLRSSPTDSGRDAIGLMPGMT